MSRQGRPRQSNGETSIYCDDAGTWHGWITMGRRPDGKLDRRHRRADTRPAVVKKIKELERQRDKGVVIPVRQRWTVAAWVEHYVQNVKGSQLAVNSSRSYLQHLETWIGPAFGHVLLQDLTVEQVETMFADVLRRGRTAATAERIRATLRAALTEAMRRSMVHRNVASLAQVAARTETADLAAPLTAPEASRLLEHVQQRPDAARWGLALFGMRPGEVLGLDWSAVDLEDGWVTVRQALISSYPYRHGCPSTDTACRERKGRTCPQRIGGRMLTDTKNHQVRRIALPDQLVAQLRTVRVDYLARRMRAGTAWESDQWGELVFSQATGAPLDASTDRAMWHDLLNAAGITGRRLYDARHTAGVLLLEASGDIQQAKDLLGHSQLSVTSRYYLHATDVLARDTSSKLGGALYGVDNRRS